MRKFVFLLLTGVMIATCSYGQLNVAKLVEPDHTKVWNFDAKTEMTFTYYSKRGSLKSKIQYETFTTNDNKYYGVSYKQSGGIYYTFFDVPNDVVVQFWKMKDEYTMANVARLKRTKYENLQPYSITETDETKEINGYKCKKLTFDDKRVSGEMWITKDVKFNPDADLIRASKMRMFGKVDVDGFVVELTSINKRWGNKTVMQVDKVLFNTKTSVDITGVEMGVSINKANWCDL